MDNTINNLIRNTPDLNLNKDELLSLCGEYLLYIYIFKEEIPKKYNEEIKNLKEQLDGLEFKVKKEDLDYKYNNLTINIIKENLDEEIEEYKVKLYKIFNKYPELKIYPELEKFLTYELNDNQKKILGIIISNIDYNIFKDINDYSNFLNILNNKLNKGIYITDNLIDFLKELGYRKNPKSVYDNAVGLGNLFDMEKDIEYCGIEIDQTIAKLSQILMIINNKDPNSIVVGNSLECGIKYEKKYDLVFSDMPMGVRFNTDLIDTEHDERFKDKAFTKTLWKSDGLFIADALHHLNEDDNSIALINCSQGLLFRPGSEKNFRQYLIEKNYIEGILYLPKNVLNGAPDAIAIMILRKNRKDNDKIKLFDLTEYYNDNGKPKIISKDKINKVVETFFDSEIENNEFVIKSKEDIKNNDYDLSISKYIQIYSNNNFKFNKNKNKIEQLSKDSTENKEKLKKYIELLENKLNL